MLLNVGVQLHSKKIFAKDIPLDFWKFQKSFLQSTSEWLLLDRENCLLTRFFYKQPTILLEPQRCLVFCDFQVNLLLSCCLIFMKKIWILKLQEE